MLEDLLIQPSTYISSMAPLNLSVALDNLGKIWLQLLDMTMKVANKFNSHNCVGMTQVSDASFNNHNSNIDDIIFGLQFMRNFYIVMAYEAPNLYYGQFSSDTSSDAGETQSTHSKLGLLGFMDSTTASDELKTFRVYGQPLPSAGGRTSSTSLLRRSGRWTRWTLMFSLDWWDFWECVSRCSLSGGS